MGILSEHSALHRPSYRALCLEDEEKAIRKTQKELGERHQAVDGIDLQQFPESAAEDREGWRLTVETSAVAQRPNG